MSVQSCDVIKGLRRWGQGDLKSLSLLVYFGTVSFRGCLGSAFDRYRHRLQHDTNGRRPIEWPEKDEEVTLAGVQGGGDVGFGSMKIFIFFPFLYQAHPCFKSVVLIFYV